MSSDFSYTTDNARIAALQVGFVSLLELIGKDNDEIQYRVTECLRQTAELPENATFREGFAELARMIEQVAPEESSSNQ